MGTPIIKGSGGATEKPYEVSFDPRRGLSVRRRYTQAGGDSDLAGIEATAQAAGYSTRKTVSPVLSELEIVSPEVEPGGGNLVVTDKWEVVGNEITKSAYENDWSLAIEALAAGVEKNVLGNVRRQVDEYNKSNGVYTFTSNVGVIAGTDVDYWAGRLFDLIIRDQTSYLTGQYVLRHTTNCSASYGGNISDSNVFKIYTTAQLLSEVQDATLWIQPMAGRLVTKIGAIPAPDDRTGYQWGWLKKPSTEALTPDNRIEITTEYWLEQWSTYLYAVVT